MSEVEPPQPITEMPPAWLPGHFRPQPPYEAELQLWIDATGKVGQVKIRSNDRRYDYHMRLAALNWRYRPAIQDGRPVPGRRVVRVRVEPQT